MSDLYHPDERVWKSYVWHNDKCFFVSTINRTYSTCCGSSRGLETIVWEYDYEKHERGKLIYQTGNLPRHEDLCRCLIYFGEIPADDEDPRWRRVN